MLSEKLVTYGHKGFRTKERLGQASILFYAFFWVIPRRLNFICRHFGTLFLFHLHRQVGVKND